MLEIESVRTEFSADTNKTCGQSHFIRDALDSREFRVCVFLTS